MSKKEQYISFIVKELEEGNNSRAVVLGKFAKKWEKSRTTFDRYWKTANERYLERITAIEKEKAEQHKQMELEASKGRINSKLDRVELLQGKVKLLNEKLESGVCMESKYRYGKVSKYERDLTPKETAALARSIKDIIAEIGKLMNDYKDANEQNVKLSINTLSNSEKEDAQDLLTKILKG